MGIIEKLRSRKQTAYIKINPRNCVACWKCVEACPKDVLGKIDFLGHRHVRISNASACIGCLKCVRTCPHGCIQPLNQA